MPIQRPLTQEEADYYQSQGIDPSTVIANEPDPPKEEIGKAATVGRTLAAHAGRTLGGGGGALASMMAAEATPLAHFAPPYSEVAVGGIAAALGALGGGYAGDKAQQAILGDEQQQKLEQSAQEAAQQNPMTAGGTDILSSMLASGGKPSLSVLPRALAGDVNATRSIVANSLINPAINSGVDYLATGEKPTLSGLLTQAGSGLVTDSAKWANRLTGHATTESRESTTTSEPAIDKGEQQGPTSPYLHTIEDNTPLIDDKGIKKEYNRLINPRPDYDGMDEVARHAARTAYDKANKIPVDEMRQELHDKWITNKQDEPVVALPKASEPIVAQPVEQKVVPREEPKVEAKIEPSWEDKAKNLWDGTNGEGQEKLVGKDSGLAGQYFDQFTPLEKRMVALKLGINEATTPTIKNSPKSDYDNLMSQVKEKIANGDTNSSEFRELWQKVEDVKNQNKGLPPVNTGKIEDVLESHLGTKNPTVKSTLQQIASTQSEWQHLANHILNTSSPEKLTVPFHIDTDEGRSHYDPTVKHISLALSDMNRPDTVMHEIAHAVTSNNLPTEFDGLRGEKLKISMDKYLANSASNPNVKELIQSYYQTAKELGVHDRLFFDKGMGKGEKAPYVRGLSGAPDESARQLPMHGYAMGDIHEFIDAVMTNKDFQRALNSMESGRNDGQSLWSRIVESIKNLLGVPVKEKSLLERALKASDEIIKAPREGEENTTNKKFAPKDITPKQKEEKSPHLGWLGNLTRSMTDKISDINHPGAKIVSGAIKKALNEIPQRFGVTGNKIVEAGQKLSKEDKVQIKKIFDYENLNEKAAPSEMFTSKAQKDFYKVEREVYKESGEYRIKNNEPVLDNGKPRQLIQKEFAHPTTPNQQVAEIYKSNTDVDKIAKLDKQFLDNLDKYGYSAKEGQEALKNFKSSLQGDLRNIASNMQYYNAARKAQGIPLPDSFTRTDPVKNLEAYYHRQAIDNSFYKNVEADHKVLGVLGADKDAWNNPVTQHPNGSIANNAAVKAALEEFHGHSGSPGEHNERSLSSLATTLFISNPALELHKLASNIIGITNYVDNPVQLGRVLGAMIKNFGEGIQHAKENGVLKLSSKSIGDAWDATATSAERMQAIAGGIRKLSSINGLSDKLSNGLMQAGAEAVLPQKIEKANNGDRNAQELLKKLDPDYVKGKQYTKDEVNKLSSTLTSYIHGTGDGRTMPAWMAKDTEMSGFFKLAHWSVSQTNRFISDVYAPATRGNLTPLLTSLFGSVIGGYLIKDLREKIQGKHGQIPSLDEIVSSEGGLANHKSLVAYNMIAGAQYAGFAGLLSQMAKYPFDFAYKNNPQGATFPIDEIATDMAKTLGQVSSAIANDKNINWAELASHVAGHVLSTDVQLSRVGINQAINNGLITGTVADKKLLSDKMGKLRRFEEIEGLPYEDQGPEAANPYMDLEIKKFRQTQDMGEAVKMLPQLITNIMTEYKNKPDVMMEKIKALKEHSYNTMPSLENMPLSFMKYTAYLSKEEGSEKAQEAVMDYLKHKAIGEAKASVIP